MTDPQVTAITVLAGDWVGVADASLALGFDSDVILRLIHDGDLPAIQVRGKGKGRTAHRLPARLIADARQLVFSGGQVELREFARQWAARNSVPVAAEVA
jgi:hypothetical protein